MRKRGNFFGIVLSSIITLQLAVAPLVQSAELNTQAFFNSEITNQASAPSPYKSDQERLDIKKLRQHGVKTKNADLLSKIEEAKINSKEKIKKDPQFKKLKQDNEKQKNDKKSLEKDRLNNSKVKFEIGDKSEKERKDTIKQLVQERTEVIEKTKKKKDNLDELKEINQKLQESLDEELDVLLTPEERIEVGKVEADYLYTLEGSDTYPNDTEINNQWEIGSVFSQFSDHFDTEASTTERIVVAIIDSGVDYTHEDLVGHFYQPATCFDETGTTTPNGCPYGGWDYVDDDNDPMPNAGETHGTNIAGIIGAQSDSNLGIASLSNNLVDIMPIRVTDGSSIELSKIIDAIYFAVENGADVINMSFTGPTYSSTLEDAIDYAEQNDVIVVAAAGNHGIDIDNTPVYPASYDFDNVVAVGALNVDHTMASFSNYGDQTVDFAAPGVDLVTTNNDDGYKLVSGSSFSAAIASAMTGALLAQGSDPLTVFVGLDESPTLVQRTINGRVLGEAVNLPPTEPIEIDIYATATDPIYGDYYIQSPGGQATSSENISYELSGANTSLAAPVIIKPGEYNEYEQIPLDDILLDWRSVPGASYYRVNIFDVDGNTVTYTYVDSGSSVVMPSSTFTTGKKYRWNVQALDSNGDYGFYSFSLLFEVMATVPDRPDTNQPGNYQSPGPAFSGTSLVFTWDSVSGADYYEINVRNLDTNKFVVDELNVTGTSKTISLATGYSYKWDMVACSNSAGCSGYSDDRYFTIGSINTPPNIPDIWGNATAIKNTTYNVTLAHNWDSDGDSVLFEVDWDHGNNTDSGSYIAKDTPTLMSHTYTSTGTFCVQARSYDGEDYSPWSGCKNIVVTDATTGADLVGILETNNSSLGASDSTTLDFEIKNIGDTTVTDDFKVDFYLSRDTNISGTKDQWLGSYDVTSNISASGSFVGNKSVPLPDAGSATYYGDGTYYIGAIVDPLGAVTEGSETNNLNRGFGIDIRSMYISGTQSGDLAFDVSYSGTPTLGSSFDVTITPNQGGYEGQVQLSTSLNHNISPQQVNVDGVTTVPVTITGGLGVTNVKVSNNEGSGVSEDFDLSGGGIDIGQATIKVTDKLDNPVVGAEVKLICGSQSSTCSSIGGSQYTQTTNSSGQVTFSGVSAGGYTVQVSFDGFTNTENSLSIVSQFLVNKYIEVSIPTDVNLTPIVFIPGIMGSTDGSDIKGIPVLRGFYDNRPHDLKIVDLAGTLGWNKMIKAFESEYGYKNGSTIIECPWDWRKEAQYAASIYLKRCIEKAKELTGKDEVDIVAHSMGGLVARAYVQGGSYDDDVRKVAFMATPHQGASEAYLLWGGIVTDFVPGAVIARLMKAKNYESDSLKYDFILNKGLLGLFYNGALLAISHQNVSEVQKVKDFIHAYVPSVKQLLPTYNLLEYDDGGNFGPHPLDKEENKFLKALNNETCISGGCPTSNYNSPQSKFGTGKVEAKVFYSSAITNTPGSIAVKRNNTDYNADGDAVKLNKTIGDGTVTNSSATWFSDKGSSPISGIIGINLSNSEAEHKNVPRYSIAGVGEFLTGQPFTASSFELDALVDDSPTLTLELEGQHQPLLTAPNGESVGITATGSTTEEVGGVEYFEVGAEFSSITLSSPASGEYTLTLQGGLEAGDYGFYLDYNSPDTKQVIMTDSFYDGATTTLSFTLAPNTDEVLVFDKADSIPENLVAENSSGSTKLTWEVPSEATPANYNIYARDAYDGVMEYQTQVSTTTYTTSDTWAGASTTLMKRYQVSAVYSNGEESFLSNAVYNNDEDRDGLPDHLEVEEGTSTSTPDTDGDGLTDGEEYFNYGTDPTMSDTDGDGISDYDEVTPGGTGSSTVAVASQVYQDRLENDWAEYGSYGAEIDYNSITEVAEGEKAIEIATDGTWSGMWIRNNNTDGLDTTGYNSLKLAYHPGNITNHTPIIRFYDENHEANFGDDIRLTDYITENILGGLESKWYNVAIPLDDIGIVNTNVSDIVLITSNTATFYIDNLHFSLDTLENGDDKVVYNNALQNNWSESGSWSVTTDFDETGITYASSSSAIKLAYNTAWAGMALTTTNVVDGSQYENLHIAYNPGNTGGQTDYIKLRNASSSDLTASYIPFSNYITGTPQTNTWYSLNIPLVDLGASTSTIGDAIILGSASTTIYLDELRFTNPVATSSTSTVSSGAVFTEDLDSPWQFEGDWSATTTFDSATANTGSYGIEMQFAGPWAGSTLLASTSIDTTDFGKLNLAYNTGATTSQTMYIKLQDPSAVDYSTYVSLSDYITGTQQTNTWYELSVPFTDIGLTPGDLVKKIYLTTSATSTVYFDDITFVASTTDPESTNQAVYTDAFQNTWTHGGSYLATTTYTSATNTTGSYGIETEFTAGQWSDSAFEAETVAVDTTNLSTLNFSYNLGATTSHTVYIKTKDETGTDHGSSVSLNNYVTSPATDTWYDVSIPLTDLGITAGELVKNIIFISQDGPTVYFDDVYFGEANTGGDNTFAEGMVTLSFDDGWLNHYTEALPILDAEGIDGTFYIVSEETIQANNLPQQVLNPSLETDTAGAPDNWQFGTWGNNDATSTYPVTGIDGSDAARVEITSYTDGDAKWYFDNVDVYEVNEYTISYQYRSDVATELIMQYTLKDATTTVYELATTSPASASWATTTVTITTPEHAENMTALPILESVGYLEIDNFTVNRNQIYVNPTQVLALEASGHEIGSHTKHHPSLTNISSAEQEDEIVDSRIDLLDISKIGATAVTTLAYPFGDYNTTVQNLTATTYSAGRSVDRGFNYTNTNKYALKIQEVNENTTLSDIEDWIQTAKQDKTWLILMFHQIENPVDHYLGTTPELLEDIADHIATDGITTVTVEEGVGLMD